MVAPTKEALAASGTPEQLHILNIVILAISIVSVIGAAWMIFSFCLFKQARTFRHQLILGLAISDLLMAINFMLPSAMNLSGLSIGDLEQKNFCSVNGFATQWFVIQTDYWVLTIAICTFLLLADHNRSAAWIQNNRIILWCIPWGLSGLWAAIGLATAGYGNIGAWCWFTSDKVRLLVNFVPRWLIIILILIIYLRLYYLIYRAHTRFASFDIETSSTNQFHITLQPGTATSTSNHEIEQGNPPFPPFSTQAPLQPPSRTHSRISPPSPILKKLAYQMMLYPLIYMFIWILPTGIRIYQAATGKAAPFSVQTVDKTCIVIQGITDAVIYGWNESSLGAWRGQFRRRRP